MPAYRTLSLISLKRLFREALIVAGGTVFFLCLAATLGLPGDKQSPDPNSAWAGTQSVARVGSAEPYPRREADSPRLAPPRTHVELPGLAHASEAAGSSPISHRFWLQHSPPKRSK